MPAKKEHKIISGVEYKECSRCKQWKLLDAYTHDSTKWDGLYGFCRDCAKIKDKAVYHKNPQKKRAQVLNYQKRTGLICKYKPYNSKYYTSDASRAKKRLRDMRRRTLVKSANEQHPITPDMVELLKLRNDGHCEYCGVLCVDNFHIDHKLPLFRGGTNDIENLAFCCPHCNWSKGKKTAEEYLTSSLISENSRSTRQAR